jgi:hypothetical protein
MGPASPCKEFKETAQTVNELVEDDEFIDLDLDDWPVCLASNDLLKCLSLHTVKVVKDQTGTKIASSRDQDKDDIVQEKWLTSWEIYRILCVPRNF